MNTATRSSGRTLWVATRALLMFTVVLGIGYTLLITGIGQLAFPAQANGSSLTNNEGDVVGSSLIGQSFTDSDGNPLPEYFQSRPSAAGDGYDGRSSSGTNWGPENEDLIAAITERKAQIAEFNGVTEADVPADAVTASSSGLDPHISPAYAQIQIDRVADVRGIPAEQVRELVAAHTQGPDAGYLGESRVNVLELNLALDELED
ncbi:potassium transporter KtrA [Microbacterium sp. PAMC 28756]|uniref:potassium-transporting ATPase subunit KdpC n=2 Tax=Actinomycetota TaxID=201174 RepID=UPI00076B6F7E|nr:MULTISPECIES: potassium-transporting ATPase subunit KdpC [Microbacterium]AMG82291.1 potassium transporter KtrA [Microbacterium sp. PAMC 28756]MCK3769956.1 potassium-transporting ATPase subunit KdpC [Microbacterium aerolatum]